jgi:erythromycin esterase-like protein
MLIIRYVQKGRNADETALDSLGDFRRFPMWMWRNTVMKDFVQWLRYEIAIVANLFP